MWPHGRRRRTTVEVPTIWEAPDDLWAAVEAATGELDPPRRGGRPRIGQRAAFNVDGTTGKARQGGISSVPPPPTGGSGG